MSEQNKYWENETPTIISTELNVFRYYPKAQILSVSLPDFIDHHTRARRIGKTVTIKLDVLTPEAKKELISILERV